MNQTKFINNLGINTNLIFTNATTMNNSADVKSPTSPPQTGTVTNNKAAASITIIPAHQQILGTFTSKTTFSNSNEESSSFISDEQLNFKTNILNTCKVIRPSVTPPVMTTISHQQHQTTPASGHVLIQTVNKKPILNHLNAKQLNTISLAPTQISSPTVSQTTYPSSSSRINLPISTLTPIQLTVSSTTTTPSINKITKCSQSSPSSMSPTNTLGLSTAAKLILNGSVNSSSANFENQIPATLKLTTPRQQQQQQQQQILKTATTTSTTITTTITNSIQTTSSLTTSMPKIVFSTTPIQIHQTNQSLPPSSPANLVLQPRYIISTTSSNGVNHNLTTTTNSTSGLLFSNNNTYSATPINLKNINSKLNDTLIKTKIIDTKMHQGNLIKTTLLHQPQQQRSTTTTTIVNSSLLESKLALEEAQASLYDIKNQVSQQRSSPTNSILTITQSSLNNTVTTTPTTTIGTVLTNSTLTPTTLVQQPIFNLIQNNSSLQSPAKPNIIRKTKSKADFL